VSAEIQFRSFGPGLGFVLHRVTFPMFAGRFSAWFDASGALLDAEHIDRRDRSRPVERDGIKWGYLAAVGRRYVGVTS
jgi:hypothetical protein